MTAKQPPFVIHVSEMADFPEAVYIGRENGRKRLKRSKWANPYKIDADCDRARAIELFTAAVRIVGPPGDLNELTGKPLACWCRRSDEPRTDDNMCHGDVLVDLWKERVGADRGPEGSSR